MATGFITNCRAGGWLFAVNDLRGVRTLVQQEHVGSWEEQCLGPFGLLLCEGSSVLWRLFQVSEVAGARGD